MKSLLTERKENDGGREPANLADGSIMPNVLAEAANSQVHAGKT